MNVPSLNRLVVCSVSIIVSVYPVANFQWHCCRAQELIEILFVSRFSQVKAMSGAEMTRNLRWWDVIALGVGGMVGAGIFVSTGSAARLSGPAVVLAYLVAGISALLSALCYTEFAVEMPVAGGAFSYLRITFGTLVPGFVAPHLLPSITAFLSSSIYAIISLKGVKAAFFCLY